MSRANASLDLMSSLALAGVAALTLVRPHHDVAITASPGLPQATRFVRDNAARLTPRRQWLPAAGTRRPRTGMRPGELTRSAGRRLNGSAAMLAFSVLADSAVEHYRGSFENQAMYTPLAVASLTLAASLFGQTDWRAKKHAVRDTIYVSAAATGLAGLGFHFYNILKRPGAWSWLNLFYAAPIGAPMALALAGLIGRGAERVRDTRPMKTATVLGLPAGRMLAAVSAVGLAGTVGEAGLLHFRGAYHNPAMLLPVTVPPFASTLLGAAILRPRPRIMWIARWWLRLTALLGLGGVGFHAYGISRNMGGWRNWSQNVLNGPPLPAPPSFTGLALAGLAALSLIEGERNG